MKVTKISVNKENITNVGIWMQIKKKQLNLMVIKCIK